MLEIYSEIRSIYKFKEFEYGCGLLYIKVF